MKRHQSIYDAWQEIIDRIDEASRDAYITGKITTEVRKEASTYIAEIRQMLKEKEQ